MKESIFRKHAREIEAMIPDLIVELTVDARNFFDESWQNQGFTDTSLEKWKPSFEKNGDKKELTLVESSALRNSLRTETTNTTGTVFTEIPYAQIHNEGGEIIASPTIREHQRKTKKGKKSTVKSHTRNVKTTMPQRQFIGDSVMLEKRHEDVIVDKLAVIFGK